MCNQYSQVFVLSAIKDKNAIKLYTCTESIGFPRCPSIWGKSSHWGEWRGGSILQSRFIQIITQIDCANANIVSGCSTQLPWPHSSLSAISHSQTAMCWESSGMGLDFYLESQNAIPEVTLTFAANFTAFVNAMCICSLHSTARNVRSSVCADKSVWISR